MEYHRPIDEIKRGLEKAQQLYNSTKNPSWQKHVDRLTRELRAAIAAKYKSDDPNWGYDACMEALVETGLTEAGADRLLVAS